MNAQASQATEQQRGSLRSLVIACAVLAAVLAPLAVLCGAVAFSRSGQVGLGAAAVAGGICWFSAALALTVLYVAEEFKNPVAGILGAMLIRMGLPLAAGLAIQRAGGPLADAGCFLMIFGLYLVALVVETWLSVRLVRRFHPMQSDLAGRAAAGGASVTNGISAR